MILQSPILVGLIKLCNVFRKRTYESILLFSGSILFHTESLSVSCDYGTIQLPYLIVACSLLFNFFTYIFWKV